MSDNFLSIIDQDWDDLAIDDGTFSDSFEDYHVRIHPRKFAGISESSSKEGIEGQPPEAGEIIYQAPEEFIADGEIVYIQDGDSDGFARERITIYDENGNITEEREVIFTSTPSILEVELDSTRLYQVEIGTDGDYEDGSEYGWSVDVETSGIEETDADILEKQIESISYNPEVNSAPTLSLDIGKDDALYGNDYLSGICDVFVGDEPLFSGEIVKVETSQRDEDTFTLKCRSPGRKLKDQSFEEEVDSEILVDYLAKTIDRFNDIHAEHFDLVGTVDETLTDINEVDDTTRRAEVDGATAEYSIGENDGVRRGDLDYIYAKIDTIEEVKSITIEVEAFNEVDPQTFTGEIEGSFGNWVVFDATDSSDDFIPGSYTLTFTMDEDTILYDWIAVANSELERNVEPQVAEEIDIQEQVQFAESNSEWQELLGEHIEDTDPFYISGASLRQHATSTSVEGEEANFLEERDDYSGGQAGGIDGDSDGVGTWREYFFSLDYELDGNGEIAFREFFEPYDDEDEEVLLPEVSVSINDGDWNSLWIDGVSFTPGEEPTWKNFINATNLGWDGQYQPDENITFRFEITEKNIDFSEEEVDGYGKWIIDVATLYDDDYDYFFDEEVHEDGGYLDGPEEYPLEGPSYPTLTFPEYVGADIISAAEISVETSFLDEDGMQEISVSFDGGSTFQTRFDTFNEVFENPSATSTAITRLGFRGRDTGARDETPRLGYTDQSVNLYEMLIGDIEIEIINSQEFSGNRLQVITDLADESRQFYRWEGNQCRIFRRGSLENNVHLRAEEITSSTDIEDTFGSCEVIGPGNISSGVIESDLAPSFVSRHKQIRDLDIGSQQDAIRRAKTFLENNGEINYTGDITTLPTRAPLGEEVSGDHFGHGVDMFIESVRYGKRRSSITFGRTKRINDEILKLDRDSSSIKRRET